jgi:hypothetical protein
VVIPAGVRKILIVVFQKFKRALLTRVSSYRGVFVCIDFVLIKWRKGGDNLDRDYSGSDLVGDRCHLRRDG